MQVKLPDFICSHVPMEIFLFYEMGKKCGNKKRFVYGRGGSFGCPSLEKNALIHKPPLLQLFTTYLLITHLWVWLVGCYG
jgi:hypothetical protein